MAGVADWLPRWDVRERHHRLVNLPPEEALQLALDTQVAGDPLVRMLFRLRGLRGLDLTIGEFSSRGSFLALERTPETYVFGIAARFLGDRRTAATAEEWRVWRPPGVKIAADLRVTTTSTGRTRLSTETRVFALDRPHRAVFRGLLALRRPLFRPHPPPLAARHRRRGGIESLAGRLMDAPTF